MLRVVKSVGLLAITLLGACAQSIPPLNFSVPNVGVSSQRLDAELRSLTVTVARPDEATGPLALGVETQPPLWATALQEALNRMAIFRDDNPRKLALSVKILKMDLPEFGIDFTTRVDARYELIDRADGSIILTQIISSSGTTPADFSFLGLARQRESVNRSVQNNITQFLQVLETADVSRPQFPTPRRVTPPATSLAPDDTRQPGSPSS